MSNQIAADLRAAAEVLRRDGWAQGDYHAAAGCHCLVGALLIVAGDDPASGDYDKAVWQRVDSVVDVLRGLMLPGSTSPSPEGAITNWNDAPGRTADEVIAALLAAADRAEAQR